MTMLSSSSYRIWKPATLALIVSLLLTQAAFSDNDGAGEFSHGRWTEILQRHVDDTGRVDYQSLSRNRVELDNYISDIASFSPDSHPDRFPDRNSQLAYYINAYNALVFDRVLDRGPETRSVWTGGLISGLQFFVFEKVTVGGQKLNLRSLENDIIRDRFQDPRIHAALNCASVSCPRLPRTAFSADELDQQLDAAMEEFVSSPQHVREGPDEETILVSEIFDWFEDDFIEYEEASGTLDPTILDYINRYRPQDRQLDRSTTVKYLDYDKSINSQ